MSVSSNELISYLDCGSEMPVPTERDRAFEGNGLLQGYSRESLENLGNCANKKAKMLR